MMILWSKKQINQIHHLIFLNRQIRMFTHHHRHHHPVDGHLQLIESKGRIERGC
jgi:hypothetical protein